MDTFILDNAVPDMTYDVTSVRYERRAGLTRCAHELAADISCIETEEDKLSVLMGLGALVAEVAALAAIEG